MQKKIKAIDDFLLFKKNNIPISMVTCYDYSMARIVANTPIDVILIGDSLGMVYAGYENTLPVTLDDMIYHTRAVRRGAPQTFTIVDMPYLSYHITPEEAVRNAGRLLKETNADAVKIEGGKCFVPIVEALVRASIPVVGHLGMTPQSVHTFGGFKLQGREERDAENIFQDALALQDAGAFSVVLELIPEPVAEDITKSLTIPTIGIGAGRICDGQVLVINDLLGFDDAFCPKFVKKYVNLHAIIKDALTKYNHDVKGHVFPAKEHVFKK